LDESTLRIVSCGHMTVKTRILIGGARLCGCGNVQPFYQKPRTPTVAPLSQIGLCDPAKADS